MSTLLAGALLVTVEASAQDPGTARAQYAQCKELLDAGKACPALVACEKGLKAMDLGNLRALSDQARALCVEKKKEQRAKRRIERACPDGRVSISGMCCWEGQTVEKGGCVGTPTSCPEGRTLDAAAGMCAEQACPDGKVHYDETHCCWEGQAWFEEADRCLGIPTCPAGLQAEGEACVAIVPDQDRDGLPDATDRCPTVAEDIDQFEDGDGCPEYDNDGDGICDALFAASMEPGAEFVEVDCVGADSCPLEPEDADGFEDSDGCAEPDNDGDGILDALDQCVLDYGTAAHNGCPPPVDHTFKIVGWSSVGVGTVLLAVGAGAVISTIDDRDQLNQPEVDTLRTDVVLNMTEVEARSIRADIDAKETLATVAFGAGGLLVAGGAVLLVLDVLDDDGMPSSEQPQEGVRFGVAPNADGGHVMLQYSF